MSDPIKVIKSLTVTDAILTGTSVTEADHAVWSAATTYAVGNRIIKVGTHRIYESLVSSNLNNDPETQPTKWIEVSPTNRWKMLDLSSTTQTQVDAADYYEFTPGQAISALAMINISGILTVRVRMTDPTFGVVYDKTVDLTALPPEATWYSWFFDPRTEQNLFVASDLPSYPSAVLRVDVTSSGPAYIGALVFGKQRTIGMQGPSRGPRIGIQDYSRKERNAWGDTVLVQRAFAKRTNLTVWIRNIELDNTYDLLTDIRSTPCLFICHEPYRSMSIFGFYTNFEISIQYADYAECSLDIEGLT